MREKNGGGRLGGIYGGDRIRALQIDTEEDDQEYDIKYR